jgi:hypothetical protein
MENKLYKVCASFCFFVVGGKGKEAVLSLSLIYHHAVTTPQQ